MIKMIITLIIILSSFLISCDHGSALPTPKVTKLSWNKYTDPKGKGFYVYWRSQSTATTSYVDTSRFKITDVAQSEIIISTLSTVFPDSSLCFVMTAYDSAGKESEFSNEVCGFVGLSTTTNVKF
jgi:hypothetical protein